MKQGCTVGIIFLLGLLVFSSFVHAQGAEGEFDSGAGSVLVQNPGTTVNDGPTPIGGYTRFYGYCSSGEFEQQLVVCASGPCTPASPSLLCHSSLAYGLRPVCVASASLANWGVTYPTSACCRADGTCSALTTGFRTVGLFYSTNLNVSSMPVSVDWRSSKVVRLSFSQYLIVLDSPSGAILLASSDSGKTWSSPLNVKSLVSSGSLPLGESLNGASAVNPSIDVDGDGVLHLAFGLVNSATGKGAVYYSNCSALPCSAAGDWGPVVPVLDSLFTTDGSTGQWNRQFRIPHLDAGGAAVHLVFDDAETNPSIRMDGIFHRWCARAPTLGVDCLETPDWSSPDAGPDITAGQSNGYAHVPALSVDAAGSVHAVWLDSAVGPGDASTVIRHAAFDPGVPAPAWSTPQSVSPAGSYEVPFVTALNSRVMILARDPGVGFRAWECSGSACDGASASWMDTSNRVANMNGVSGIQSYALLTAPHDPARHVLLATALDQGVTQLLGLYENGSTFAGPLVLSRGTAPFGTVLAGVGNPFHFSQSDSLDWVDFLGARSNGLTVFSSNVFDFSNVPPSLSLFSSPSFPLWRNPNLTDVSTTPYSESIQFSVSDSNPEDVLYATLYAGVSPGGMDYTLLDHVRLDLLQGVGGSTVCAGADFLSPRVCTIDVPLFALSPGLLLSDGEYHLTLLIQDSGYGQATSALPGPITIDASPSVFTLITPVGGEVLNPTQPAMAMQFRVENPAIVHDLSVALTLQEVGGDPVPYGSLNAVEHSTISPECIMEGSPAAPAYQCTFNFVSPPNMAEGTYDFSFALFEDAFSNATAVAPAIHVDFAGPQLVDSFPSGILNEPPIQLSFTLADSAGIPNSPAVTVNGQPRSVNCTPSGPGMLSCSRSFPSGISSGSVVVVISSSDSLTNSSVNTYSFEISSTSACPPGQSCPEPPGPTGPTGPTGSDGSGGEGNAGGGGGPDCIGPLCGIIQTDEAGNEFIPGLPFIPHTVVDTVVNGAEATLTVANDLVEVTGPSASAIFLGLCTLAGLASDAVFRRIFTGILPDVMQQRQRVLRAVLAGIFFAIPFLVNVQFSLAVGFVFVIMEIVGFLGASYVYKVLQYYETFGFKPVEAAK